MAGLIRRGKQSFKRITKIPRSNTSTWPYYGCDNVISAMFRKVLQTDRLVIQSELLQTHRLLLMQLCLT